MRCICHNSLFLSEADHYYYAVAIAALQQLCNTSVIAFAWLQMLQADAEKKLKEIHSTL